MIYLGYCTYLDRLNKCHLKEIQNITMLCIYEDKRNIRTDAIYENEVIQ